ncbi:hypothetical protein WMF39_22985 [Sorangium sp. So ce1504]|uniref:hypothetical protein n=1 Tax=Sorangium sp. So ce1504 TaxID=3133337 RepID=UPI003F62255C
MSMPRATYLSLVFPLLVAGCGTAPVAVDPGGASCDGTSSCHDEAPPESFCLERLAADVLEDGCGVFVANFVFGGGDDANPGTREKPVRTLQRGIELARTGRGRVFSCHDGFYGPLTLPSGVDLIGGYNCLDWTRQRDSHTIVQHDEIRERDEFLLTVEPASAGDTGAADGISTIVDVDFFANSPIAILARSNTAVEITRSTIRAYYGFGAAMARSGRG